MQELRDGEKSACDCAAEASPLAFHDRILHKPVILKTLVLDGIYKIKPYRLLNISIIYMFSL